MFTDIEVPAVELVDIYENLSRQGKQSVAKKFEWPLDVAEVLSKQKLFHSVLEGMEQDGVSTVTIRKYGKQPLGIPTGLPAEELNEAILKLGIKGESIPQPFTILTRTVHGQTDHELLHNDVFRIGREMTFNFLDGKVDTSIALLRMICTNRAVIRDKTIKSFRKIDIDRVASRTFNSEFDEDVLKRLTEFMQKRSEIQLTASNLLASLQVAERLDTGTARSWIEDRLWRIIHMYDTRHFKREIRQLEELKAGSQAWKDTAILPLTAQDNLYELWNILTEEETNLENEGKINHETAFANNIAIAQILALKTNKLTVATLLN